ncbi:hypothetical protein C8F01DRAFT_1231641 [Mycena amicta]|nr:hypothetical protein C8F01DRAFT_1231641 [Mycena amicta]
MRAGHIFLPLVPGFVPLAAAASGDNTAEWTDLSVEVVSLNSASELIVDGHTLYEIGELVWAVAPGLAKVPASRRETGNKARRFRDTRISRHILMPWALGRIAKISAAFCLFIDFTLIRSCGSDRGSSRGTERSGCVTCLLSTLMRDARTLLPVELWEHILYHVPSTEDLLTRLASVCTLYNELCIRICLERQGVSTEDLQKPILHLSGAIIRPICLLPRTYTFPARQVNSHVDPTQIPSEVRRLVGTLERCVSLEALSIPLQSDPFQVSRPSRPPVLSGLCKLLSEVAARNSAPVFVLVGQDRFSCMPVDISLWKLHEFEFNPPSPDPVYFGALSYTWTRLHTGNATRAQRLTSLESVDLTLVEKSASQRALSLLTLNRASITQLVLGRPKEFVPYLTSMLWHISLPNLRDLNIYTDKINPAALHYFLVHHPLIENVDFALPSNDNAISNPLLDAPLAHPNIVSLFARAKVGPCAHPIIRFLCASPKIRTFGFALDPFGPTSHAHPFLRSSVILAILHLARVRNPWN